MPYGGGVYTVAETPLFQRLADDHWTEEIEHG